MFLTGGCANIKNFAERLTTDLRSVRPFQSEFNVCTATNPGLDSWYGAKKVANSSHFKDYCITKEMYSEMGGEYLQEHGASNIYYRTPLAPSSASYTVDEKATPVAPV